MVGAISLLRSRNVLPAMSAQSAPIPPSLRGLRALDQWCVLAPARISLPRSRNSGPRLQLCMLPRPSRANDRPYRSGRSQDWIKVKNPKCTGCDEADRGLIATVLTYLQILGGMDATARVHRGHWRCGGVAGSGAGATITSADRCT